MSNPDINEELRRLSARLDRLERLFDLESLEREPVAPAKAPPMVAAGPARRESTVAAIVESERTRAARRVEATGAPAGTPPGTTATAGTPPSPADRTSIELAIGGRRMAWVGAIAVVIGIGLLFMPTSIAYAKLSPRLLGGLDRIACADSGDAEGGAQDKTRPAD